MLKTNPSYVLFDRATWHHDRPSFIEEAIKRCASIEKKAPFLLKIGDISKKQLAALKSFSQALLHYTDLATLQYGVWNKEKGTFIDFDLKILRRVTGLSKYYFNRCIALLKKSGYMTVYRTYKKIPSRHIHKGTDEYNKAFKSFPAVRRLCLSFFIDLGFNKERLELNKRSALNKHEDKVRKEKFVKAELNKPCPHKFHVSEPTKKDPNGAKHMAAIKEAIRNMRFGKRSPDPDP